MYVANEYVAPIARLINESYDVDSTAIIAFDSTLDAAFVTSWQSAMVTVEALVFPEVITRQMSGQIEIRNSKMVAETPLITVLSIRIASCITAGTITDPLSSFMLDKLNASINNLSITKFDTAFAATISQVLQTDNAAALNTAGFTTAMQNTMVSNHKAAMLAQIAYNKLKISRKNLSPANLLSIKILYDMTMKVCTAGIGAFSMPLVEEKLPQYTITKVLDSVRPTPPTEPRDRHIKATKSVCLKTNPVKRDTLQMTLKTKTSTPVYFCMQDLKTGICTSGGELHFNETITIVQKNIPGSGKHLIITNQNLINIVVATFTIKG